MILKAPLPHRITAVLMAFLATLFLSLSLLSPAMAREMVSVKGKLVNMRSGPGTRYQVNWQLEKGYPLQIIARKGKWLKVRDFENDQGWISRSVTTSTPHYIVKVPVANIRKGPGTRHAIVAKAVRYDLLRTRERRGNWVRVKHVDGPEGWVSRKLLWGW
jgi:SH3-like domain-containing protein